MVIPTVPEALVGLVDELDDPLVVIDVGARWGVFDSWSGFGSSLRVVAVDPDPDECDRLNADAPPWCRYYPIALGASSGTTELIITSEPACSSIYQPRADLVEHVPELHVIRPVRRTTVPIETTDDFLNREQLPPPHVLKLDTQGSELDVLMGAAQALETVDLIEVEVEFNPLYEGQPLFPDVDRFVRTRGFELWRISPLVHYGLADQSGPGTRLQSFFSDREESAVSASGQLFWGQAYYLRSDFGIGRDLPSRPAAIRLAIGAHGLGLYDLRDWLVQRLDDGRRLN